MRAGLALVLFSYFGLSNCQSQTKLVRRGYSDSLNHISNMFSKGNTPHISSMEFCLPETDAEYLIYFKAEETTKGVAALTSKIRELVLSGNSPLMRKYLLLSNFIDGYPAEPYFEDYIPAIVAQQRTLFCETVSSLPKESKQRLLEFIQAANCK